MNNTIEIADKILNYLAHHKVTVQYDIAKEEFGLLDMKILNQIFQDNGIEFKYDYYFCKLFMRLEPPLILNKLKMLCEKLVNAFEENEPDTVLKNITEIKKYLKIADKILE